MNAETDVLRKRIEELEAELDKARLGHTGGGDTLAYIQEMEGRFRAIADTAPVLIWLSGPDKLCYFFNKGWLDFTGRTMEQELGNGWTEGVHPDDLERCLDIYTSHFDARKEFSMDYRLRRHDGQYRWISDKGVPRYTSSGTFIGYVGGCMDIHDQITFSEQSDLRLKDLNRKLKIQNSIFKHSEENANIGSYAWNVATNELECSDNLYRLIGYQPQEFTPSFEQFLSFLHPEDRHRAIRDGIRAYETKVVVQNTYRVIAKNGDIKYFRLSGNFIREGENHLMIGALQDVTKDNELNDALHKKNMELRRNNEELASFSYVASHDLQEPLRKIRAFSSRIMEKEAQHFSESTKDYFERIIAASARMQKLIEALLNYSGTSGVNFQFVEVDLTSIVEEVKSDLEELITEKGATVEVDQLPVLPVIPVQFHQLLQNLIGNGIKYSSPDRKPVVRIGYDNVDDNDGQGTFCRISVTDNGIGFDQRYENRIFDLFQRLHGKNEYEGTGIGLAICKKIAQNHHGYITAEGMPGVGSVFHVFIPTTLAQH